MAIARAKRRKNWQLRKQKSGAEPPAIRAMQCSPRERKKVGGNREMKKGNIQSV